jgi:formamidopyrimidine-DNA glycosylase
MPELPEVQTTVNGLNKVLKHHTITGVWSDYYLRTLHKRTDNIKNEKFFNYFKKEITGAKFIKSERRGKNVLIHLSNSSTPLRIKQTILIHMKMTGHLLYGKYVEETVVDTKEKKIKKKIQWKSEEKNLKDPFNQFIHFIINFDNGKSLAFSDMRKFAKVTLVETSKLYDLPEITQLGPEANDLKLDWKTLRQRLLAKRRGKNAGKVKTVLMDQTVVAGIGNIYSDEILWTAGIHPERHVSSLSDGDMKNILAAARKILAKSITVGGDSMSDYRNIYGERGGFQNSHKAYRQTGKACQKKGCSGIILRKIIGGRSTHFCSVHQK